MSKRAYDDPDNLGIEESPRGWADFLFNRGTLALALAAIAFLILVRLIPSARERELEQENQRLLLQVEVLDRRISTALDLAEQIAYRDDYLYRQFFEMRRLPTEKRTEGFGGVNRYQHLQGYDFSDVLIRTSARLDLLSKQLYLQSTSFDHLYKLLEGRDDVLASLPLTQPISSELLEFVETAGAENKTLELFAEEGTPVLATGDGKILSIGFEQGLGNHVIIEHMFGYTTLYANLGSIMVNKGEQVKRGQAIGTVGKPTGEQASNLRYEIRKGQSVLNPTAYFFGLSEEKFMEEINNSTLTIKLD